MLVVEIKKENPVKNEYGFVGVNYLCEKYSCSYEEILNLFIECDYSIAQTVQLLEKSTKSDFAA